MHLLGFSEWVKCVSMWLLGCCYVFAREFWVVIVHCYAVVIMFWVVDRKSILLLRFSQWVAMCLPGWSEWFLGCSACWPLVCCNTFAKMYSVFLCIAILSHLYCVALWVLGFFVWLLGHCFAFTVQYVVLFCSVVSMMFWVGQWSCYAFVSIFWIFGASMHLLGCFFWWV